MAIRNEMDSGRSSGPTSGTGPAPILSANDGNEVLKQLRRTHKKVETMEEALQNRLSVVANEVLKRLITKNQGNYNNIRSF